ncbi:MAG: lipo-like protein [Candidatus Marinimicrobia bacterium]|nr:lipo-like protein [Candidatus Neomarinimicrobiota bacterium]
MLNKIKTILKRLVFTRLNRKSTDYFHRIPNNMKNLKRYIRKGDVVLVEGNQRLSELIKLFTQSHWSHSAFYVGNELIKEGSIHRDKILSEFGDQAKHMVVEAITGQGVIVSPLDKYEFYNLRVSRPYGITKSDIKEVVKYVVGNIGREYDNRNIYDIAFSLLPLGLNPWKKKSLEICIGNCDEFTVTCSGLIAKAFHFVGYPISPAIDIADDEKVSIESGSPYGQNFTKRHFSHITPADFDLSPNFSIIKFNIIEDGDFDYKSLELDEEKKLNRPVDATLNSL